MSRGKLIALVVGIGLVIGAVFGGVTALLVLDDDENSEESDDGGREDTPPRDEDPGAREAPSPELQSFYDQEIDWDECDFDDDFDCGWLEVPLDYDDAEGETLELRVARDPADEEDDRVGSLLVNPGGPGSSGVDLLTYDAFGEPLTDAFDIVGWDPRGTGESSPIDCLSDEDLDDYLSFSVDLDTPEGQEEYVEQQERFGEGCEELSGDLVNHISTVETAKDMDVLRAVLGDEQLNYLGFSYGTTLGAVYATYFPERSERLVLDGATDPGLDRVDGALSQIAGFETAWDNYVADCVDSGCSLGETAEEVDAAVDSLLDGLLTDPIDTGDPERPLTQQLGQTGIQAALYGEENWPYLTQGLQGALDGDGELLLLLADFYSDRADDGSYSSNLMEAFYAISCLDDPTSFDPTESAQYADDFEEASPTFGENGEIGLSWCSGYPGRQAEEPLEVTGAGAAPILVVGTTGDPATPYEEAVAMASALESGVLLTREGEGHTAYGSGNECIDETIEAFLIDGEVPEDGKVC